ncbi:MAG: RIP metalloprotease RseP [Terracidiphilus sp.]
MHEFLVSVAAFIVLLGIMVVVHEFGHFAVAKLCKVRVERFSIGFPPRLFGIQIGETDYCISATPLGGYVKMTGENFSELSDAATGKATVAPVDDPGALTSHPRWQRMLIGAAGPVANFVLAFVLMFFYFSVINEVPAIHPIVVEWVSDGSPAAQAGILPGDVIQSFNNLNNPSWYQIETIARQSVNRSVPVTVEREGKDLPLTFRLSADSKDKRRIFDLSQAGLFLQFVKSPIKVESVIPNSPAQNAGMLGGDMVLAADGHAFHTLEPMIAYLQSGHGKPVTLSVSRNGQMIAPMLVHPSMQDGTWRIGFNYFPPTDIPTHDEPMLISPAIDEAKDFCVENSTLIIDMLGRILTHKVSASQLSGPVGIAQMAGQAAEAKKWSPKFGLAALISLNLGILNLLPFPILDGGMILFLLIEGVLRREISISVKERIYQAAFVMLMALAVVVIFNDVTKLPVFTHLKP